MNCPICPGAALEPRPSGNVLVDRCATCSGLWLDKGEAYFMVSDPKALHAAFAEAYKKPENSALFCPRCLKALLRVTFSDGLRIEACRSCGGNWLDRGELEALGGRLREPIDVIAPPGREKAAPIVPLDVFMHLLPFILGLTGLAATRGLGESVMGGALGYLVKLWYSHPADEPEEASVAALDKHGRATGLRGIAARVSGTVVSSGAVSDWTGSIPLDYPKAARLSGRAVTAAGWYRRASTPFIEVRRLDWEDGSWTSRALEVRYVLCLGVLAAAAARTFGLW